VKSVVETGSFIDEEAIGQVLESVRPDPVATREVLAKARGAQGLEAREMAQLMTIEDPELLEELFSSARQVKEDIYGRRLVLFAPLYVSNLCSNECAYCAFRVGNKNLKRKALTQDEVRTEVEALVNQGHKRLLIVAGETQGRFGLEYISDCIATAYGVKTERGEIRRINVNLAPLTVEEFRELKKTGIGTFQLFQETYHRQTYRRMHTAGPKSNYDWRVTGMHRAMAGGVDDVGIGVLFGLADWRFEMLAMLQHIRSLEQHFGVGPHTISVPRMEPAHGSDVSIGPPAPVSDQDFLKIVAITRLTVPYTGMIMSTRESAEMRNHTLALGISQISAGSRTNPGGYQASGEVEEFQAAQFQLGDHRDLDEVIREVAGMGYLPSFCTACYRLGRTGQDFMDLARPGEIKDHCNPNAVATFLEYLQDYASPETRQAGEAAIAREVAGMEGVARQRSESMAARVRTGEHDVIC